VTRTFLDVLDRVMRHGVTGTASQFAYNAFLATIPFVFVIVTAVSLAGSDAYESLFDALEGTIPGITGLAPEFDRSTATGAAAGLLIAIGVAAGLYVASNALGALVHGLDRAHHLNHRPWLRGKLINLGFAAGTTILAVLSTLLLAGREELVRGFARLVGGSDWVEGLNDAFVLPIGVGSLFAFTLLLYRFGPNGMRLKLRWVVPGAILSVAFWLGTTLLLGIYVDNFKSFDTVYGSLGAIVVYLTFLYFSGLMFLVGAELNAELIHRRLVRASRQDTAARDAAARVPATRQSDTAPAPAASAAPKPAGADAHAGPTASRVA
jgi:membrane protein